MKRKHLFYLIPILLVFLNSCNNNEIHIRGTSAEEVSFTHTEGNIEYIVNTDSLKYHLPDCVYAKNIKADYADYCSDENLLIEKGYTKCAHCFPKD